MTTPSKWETLPTEAINPASLHLDKASAADIVDLMIAEDKKVVAAVQRERERIAHGVEIIAQAVRKNGRIIFIGAGTSGRLGIVEAAEMPPTFGTPRASSPSWPAARTPSSRPARREDDYEGARAVADWPTMRDVVVGVSASGITPFVRED
jgi:N-acetylmuramic acid 6-phosphate etherase